jgi:hypothetical protein
MADRSMPSTCLSSPDVTKAMTSWLIPFAAKPNLAAISGGNEGTDAGTAGEGLAPAPPDAAGEPARSDGPAVPGADADGLLLAFDGVPVGDTSPQATARAVTTARTAARRSRERALTVTAGGGYRDWPPAVPTRAGPRGAGILAA